MTAPRSVDRLKLFAACLALTLVVFWQSPGDTATDTKFDLIISPWRFLARSTRLWDPITSAGTLQNQAYGYLFPMGPFFGLLHSIGLTPWMIQRTWESTVLVVAFLGVVRLTRLLGVPGLWPRVAAGLAYTMAPRMLSELTSISSELMPVAALPWILVPLVRGAQRGSPRRAGARSGVALLLAGGVNAGATLAILPAPALWLLCRQRGPRRAMLTRWWMLATGLACAWWAIPLLLLGRYSPPFLDWIETSAVTTEPTSVFANLRGVDHWESYLGPGVWPAGWIMASVPAVVIATALMAGFGLCGLARRDAPERTFLLSLLLLGLVILGAGHLAPVGPPLAGQTRTLLDTSLAAFRNIHKFDPLVRLPIAIGIGHLVSAVGLPDQVLVRRFVSRIGIAGDQPITIPVRRFAALALAVVGIVAATPALTGQLVANPRITAEPGWWRDTGAWLGIHSDGNRALVVPGSAAPAYLWGKTTDDALQPVATTPWTTRDAVPLTQAGYVRFLNAMEQLVAQGQPSSVLATALARSGIGFVVLRNDLNTFTSASTPTVLVRNTLATSPGFRLEASFGPLVGGSSAANNVLDGGLSVPRPSVEIFGLTSQPQRVAMLPVANAIAANGSADTLPDLIEAGLSSDSAVLFGSDADGVRTSTSAGLPTVLTDGIRRQQASFANLLTTSTTLASDEPYSGARQAYDYLPDNAGQLSQYVYGGGVSSVLATSSGDAQYALANRGDDNGPWSAIDGDPATAWRSSAFTGAVGQSITVRFSRPVPIHKISVSFVAGLGPMPTQLEITTQGGSSRVAVLPVSGPQLIAAPDGSTTFLTVGVAAVFGNGNGASVGISDIGIPGITPTRSLVIAPIRTAANLITFHTGVGQRAGCLPNDGQVYCENAFAAAGQEELSLSRTFTLGDSARYVPSVVVQIRPGKALNRLLSQGAPIVASASSVSSDDPRVQAQAAVDGDPLTYWRALPGDARPTLTLTMPAVRTVRAVHISLDPRAAAGRPERLTVRAGNESWSGALPDDGIVTFPHSVSTRSVTITITQTQVRTDTNSLTVATTLLPAGIGEVALLPTQKVVTTSPTLISIPCSSGPALVVDGTRYRFAVRASVADAMSGRPVTAILCTPGAAVTLGGGVHNVALQAGQLFTPYSMSLSQSAFSLASAGDTGAAGVPITHTLSWGATHREVAVTATQDSLLAVRENFNSGWQAMFHGHRLTAIRVDGWQQAWIVPAGTSGTITLDFAPQKLLTGGLIVGGLGALILALLALRLTGGAERPGIGGSRANRWLWRTTVAIACGALAGPEGLAIGIVVVAATWAINRYSGMTLEYAAPLLTFIAALVVVVGPHLLLFARSNDPTVQLICVAAVAVAAVSAPDDPRQPREA